MIYNREKLLNEFKNYVSNYDMTDDGISRKYFHSISVMDKAGQLAKSINLSEKDTNLAVLIGLLHDYARFEQWKNYHTYSDIKTVDHGDLGVEILFDQGEIKKYTDDEEQYEIIKKAIKYHNKYAVPEEFDEREKLFCNLIRDADKLDIFEIKIREKFYQDIDEPIAETSTEDFFANRLVRRTAFNNKNDEILIDLAWIYDLNFNFSMKYVYEQNIIKKIYDFVNNKEKFEKYFTYIESYIKEKMTEMA